MPSRFISRVHIRSRWVSHPQSPRSGSNLTSGLTIWSSPHLHQPGAPLPFIVSYHLLRVPQSRDSAWIRHRIQGHLQSINQYSFNDNNFDASPRVYRRLLLARCTVSPAEDQRRRDEFSWCSGCDDSRLVSINATRRAWDQPTRLVVTQYKLYFIPVQDGGDCFASLL